MRYNPNYPDEMDENEVSAEIGDFVNDQLFDEDFAVPGESAAPAEPSEDDLLIPLGDTILMGNLSSADAAKIIDMIDQQEAAAAPAAPADHDAPTAKRKTRPKRKHETFFGLFQFIATGVWLALILFIGVTLGRGLWVCAADVLAFGRPDEEVSITVTADDDLDSIIVKLSDAGLIQYDWLFRLYADLSGAEEDIVTGTFTLNRAYDYHALVNEMSSNASKREEITVQIPEGYTCRQIFELLEEKGVATAADLEEYAANGDLDGYWFLENVERGDKYCLEGYLFPDTYKFFTGGGAQHALRKLLNGFKNQFDEDLQNKITVLNNSITAKILANGDSQDYASSHLFTVREVIIVASLIEKEAASPTESPNIASVIYNRLFSWGSNPRYLNIDAAIVYALDGKTDLTSEDLQIDHPYNTYKNLGLTPGPIANPGKSSIMAALEPASTNYYYYVLDPATGQHVFSSTYSDHVAAGG